MKAHEKAYSFACVPAGAEADGKERRKLMKDIKNSTIALIIALFVTVLGGAALIIALLKPTASENVITASSMFGTRVIYTCLFLGILLILLLIGMIIINFRLNKAALLGTGEEITPDKKAPKAGKKRPRFFILSETDKRMADYELPDYQPDITLEEMCVGFRNYAAGTLGLYYSQQDIRKFICSLGTSRLVIMQGISGTGKTSLAYAIGKYLQNDSTIIPVQPLWKERSDMLGYFNEFTGRFSETQLLRKLYEANYTDEIYITVLDEMNIARVEYYFAEFLSLLELPEASDRMLDVVSDKWDNDPALLADGRLRLPDNMWFIGTANNDDSTFSISDKVYDRAMPINLNRRAERFDAPDASPVKISAQRFRELVLKAKEDYVMTSRTRRKIQALDEYLIDAFRLTFGNRIMAQLETYSSLFMACGGTELEAADDLTSKKILRKLEALNPVFVKNSVPALVEKLNELFDAENMLQCKEYLNYLESLV